MRLVLLLIRGQWTLARRLTLKRLLHAGLAALVIGAWPVFRAGHTWRALLLLVVAWQVVTYMVQLTIARHDVLAQASPTILDYQTSKFDVRAVELADLKLYEESVDSEMMRSNGWTDQHREVNYAVTSHPLDLFRRGLMIVIDRGTQEAIAFGRLTKEPSGELNLAFWMMPGQRGKGLANGAFSAVMRASHLAGIDKISVGTDANNAPMRAVITKTGCTFVREGPRAFPDGSTRHALWFEHRQSDGSDDYLVNLPSSRS